MNILLIGPTGQIGFELRRTLAPLGEVITAGRSTGDIRLDLSEPDKIESSLGDAEFDLIVNASAYTQVDLAETDGDLADRINGHSVGRLANWAASRSIPLVHYSTDYVFAGDSDKPLQETEPVQPINRYGESKLLGEKLIAESGCSHLILRTAWVYGNHGKNFLKTILAAAQVRDRLSIVSDQYGAPAWSRMLAELTAHAARQLITSPDDGGIYHLSANGQTTWHGFAVEFLTLAHEMGLSQKMPEIQAVTSDQFQTPAMRPAHSVLDNAKFEGTFGLRVPNWQEQLALCMAERMP